MHQKRTEKKIDTLDICTEAKLYAKQRLFKLGNFLLFFIFVGFLTQNEKLLLLDIFMHDFLVHACSHQKLILTREY